MTENNTWPPYYELSSVRKELEEFWLKVIGVFLVMGNYGDCVFRSPEEYGMWRPTHKNKEPWPDPRGCLPTPTILFMRMFQEGGSGCPHDITLKVRTMTPISPNPLS